MGLIQGGPKVPNIFRGCFRLIWLATIHDILRVVVPRDQTKDNVAYIESMSGHWTCMPS